MADFEARFADFRIPRFTSIDPLAEKYYSVSPYAYCANNPIVLIDPTGENILDFLGGILKGFVGGAENSWNFVTSDIWKGETWKGMWNFGGDVLNSKSIVEHPGIMGITIKTVEFIEGDDTKRGEILGGALWNVAESALLSKGASSVGKLKSMGTAGKAASTVSKADDAVSVVTKKPYAPIDNAGNPLKVEKTKAGNIKVDAEARGTTHTQLRVDKSENYIQRNTIDTKGRRRVDTHFTTHGEAGKSNPHKHVYYKHGKRQNP